jgi:HSP20 family protein
MDFRSLIPFRGTGSLTRSETGLLGSLHRDVDRLFDEFSRNFGALGTQANANLVPSNVSETDKEVEITAEMPGLERKDVDVTFDDNVLTIRGEKKIEKEDNRRNHHLVERSYGVFYTTLELPPVIDPSTVQAKMAKGILKITIPKPAQTQTKKIEVKDGA